MTHIKRESKIWYTPKKRNSKITYDYFRSLKIEKKKKKKKRRRKYCGRDVFGNKIVTKVSLQISSIAHVVEVYKLTQHLLNF